jgi:small-conductance mechanosensitive channel
LLLVVLQWLVVFTTNLNIYSSIYDKVVTALTTTRNIGNASFTFGGILLFFLIIWIAHLLQKYVGYFFGDAGLDDENQNKQQRSRLLITKLIVLSIGYLLAVAASGIPIDKITIVLGALGVGIGLGLQNIVSNFVSGIILIFDRPLQIGDSVEIGDQQGKVREIGLRSSIIQTKEGAEVIIPNGDLLSQPIVNWTLSNSQQRLELGFRTERGDMEEVAKKAKELVLSSPFVYPLREPQVLFTKMDANTIEIKVYCWCIDTNKVEEAKSDLLVRSYKSKMELLPE